VLTWKARSNASGFMSSRAVGRITPALLMRASKPSQSNSQDLWIGVLRGLLITS
jgi:hypothetical protein